MHVTIRLWAGMRLAAGRDCIELVLPEGSRLEDALATLYAEHAELRPHAASARTAIEKRYVDGNPAIEDHAEIHLIPPVQGG